MYQKLIVAGYLGGDPEMRYLPDGTAVTNFSVASTRRFTVGEGEQHEETTWFRVETWRRQAETCHQFLTKGSPVLVEGRLKPDKNTGGPRTYQRQDGSIGASYELVAETVRFLGRSSGNGHNGQSDETAPTADPLENLPF
ncbi:MAG: single-stranded DNA-binding protein [Anaerolineae bacterium]|nr:single-stranded DNA-binding protein [Anaerolineae bacterium]